MRVYRRASLLGFLSCLVASTASAQGWEEAPSERTSPSQVGPTQPTTPDQTPAYEPGSATAPPPPPPAIRVETPPPAPAGPRRRAQVHDGFYLRMSLGGDYISAKVKYDGDFPDRRISGGGLALDLMIGGTPVRGLAVGGGLWVQTAGKPKTKIDSGAAEEYEDLGFGMLGLFVDGFPDPERGFHVGGALALASLNASFKGDTKQDPKRLGVDGGDLSGIGSHVWVGYDGWVSQEWALGGMLRLSGASVGSTNDELEQRANVGAFALLFSAVYH